MLKLRRRKKRPEIIDWEKNSTRPPTKFLPVGFPFVTCRPLCPCRPVNCGPGTIFYPTTCQPSITCLPTVPPGCVPRPCFPF